jgi:C_GCAxxG_C_C family probable redox protein
MNMSRTGKTDSDRSPKADRRRFIALAGGGIGVGLFRSRRRRPTCRAAHEILKPGQKIQVQGNAQQIIQTAYRLGHEYQEKHGGCAQCAVAALQDAIPFAPRDQDVFRAASCLDGGATPIGLQNCGAFTGCGMVIGHLCGRTRDAEFRGSPGFSRDLIRKVYQRFEQDYGSVLCKDVKKAMKGNCPGVVAAAAKWTAEVLLNEFAA